MKNAIKYYYNLEPIDIHFKNNNYFFNIEKQYYVLYFCVFEDKEIEKINNLHNELLQYNIYTHQIIVNILESITTIIDGKKYVLMKMYNQMLDKINLEMLVNFNEQTAYISMDNNKMKWKSLWEQKIDYFEYQINQIGKKFLLIRKSFSYFVGMTENAIQLLVNFNNDSKLSIGHRRINRDSTTFDLYNPFNFIIDYKIRDICEYFKYSFIKKEDVYDNIVKYITNVNLTNDECYLFLIRMLFPSFYFDYYEGVMDKYFNENIIDEHILMDIDKVAERYEILLKKIYLFLKRYISMPKIEWLED